MAKRSVRMREYFRNRGVPENAWLGVTVEDKKHGKPRISDLREVNAKVLFLSCEPLLEDLGQLDLSGIHWVIAGGESGPHARPMRQEWVESIKNQCNIEETAFFFKQWGVWGDDGKRRNKKSNGCMLGVGFGMNIPLLWQAHSSDTLGSRFFVDLITPFAVGIIW